MLTLLSVLDGPDHPGLVLDLDVTTSVWVVDADQIVVMDNGRVVATGRHDQLLETCPLYRELATHQLLVPDVSPT